MPVRIVFSDGSRRLAHNNDDLYERWILRRSEDEQRASNDASYQLETFIPDLPNEFDLEIIQLIKNDLQDKRLVLDRRLAEINKGSYEGNRYWYRAPFAAAVTRINCQSKIIEVEKNILECADKIANSKVQDIRRRARKTITKWQQVKHILETDKSLDMTHVNIRAIFNKVSASP